MAAPAAAPVAKPGDAAKAVTPATGAKPTEAAKAVTPGTAPATTK